MLQSITCLVRLESCLEIGSKQQNKMDSFHGAKNVSDIIARLMEIKHSQEVEIGVLILTQKHLKASMQSLQSENRHLNSEINSLQCGLAEALRDSSLLQVIWTHFNAYICFVADSF